MYSQQTIILTLLMESLITVYTSDIHEKMIEMINACFTDRLKTLTTTPDLLDVIAQISTDIAPIPMMIIDDDFKSNKGQNLLPHLGIFVFATNPEKSFGLTLLSMKFSPWWNDNALFIIVENLQDQCTTTLEILLETWRMGLQSVLFMCEHYEEGAMLYTYNPYASRTPFPWKEVEFSKEKDNPWTLFVQRYTRGADKCGSLDFHRTKFFDVCKTESGKKLWDLGKRDQRAGRSI